MVTISFTQSNGVHHEFQSPYSDEQAVAKLQSLVREKPNEFASKMIDNYFRYRNVNGSTRGWIHKLAVEGLDKPKNSANATTIGQRANERIVELFSVAKTNGLKAPKLRLRKNADLGVQLYYKANSYNNTIYVNDLDKSEFGNYGYQKVYYGKIENGEFIRSRNCPTEVVEMIEAFADDPAGAALAYGRMTNECCLCGRPLVDAKSVAAGIGPVCAKKWGI